MIVVSIRESSRLKTALKGLLFIALAAYIVFPVYLYGFTPMGTAVVQFIHETLTRDNGTQVVESSVSDLHGDVPSLTESVEAKEQPLSVLLMGYGGEGHDGPYLTDSMVLVIADPKTRSLSLLSLPRDTLVELPFEQQTATWVKINSAYAYGIDQNINSRRPERYKGPNGGGNLAKDVVSNVVGFQVRYYIAADFAAFRKLIDEVGGIDVTVQSAFSARYPKEDDPSIDPDWTVVRFEAGRQHMSGERALQYARAREAIDNMAEGSDFARSRRQRQIMQEFRDKLMSPGGLIHIPGLLGIAKQRISTDVEVPGMTDLEKLLTDWRGARITEVSLTSDNYLTSESSSEKGYYLTPVAGLNNWSQIHTLVGVLLNDPSLAEEMARTKVIVRNGSGRPEKGQELRDKLMAQGFAVAPLETVAVQPSTRIEDMTEGNANRLIDSLISTLGDPETPVKTGGYPSPRVAIVLGQD